MGLAQALLCVLYAAQSASRREAGRLRFYVSRRSLALARMGGLRCAVLAVTQLLLRCVCEGFSHTAPGRAQVLYVGGLPQEVAAAEQDAVSSDLFARFSCLPGTCRA